jgi:uncharacterized damage-inducible protein DinB
MQTITRQQLLAALAEARHETEAAIAGLSAAQLQMPGAAGNWTVKDVLAHITAWEVEMHTALGKVRRGLKPGRVRWDKAAIALQNERWYAQYKDRPLERVLEDFNGVRRQTQRLVERLSDAELAAALKWWNGMLFAKWIRDFTVDHEADHLLGLRAFRAAQAGNSADEQVSGNGAHGSY